jgi:predicted ATPase
VGNGRTLLAGIDGRSTGARRFREVLTKLANELALEKQARITEQDMVLIRRAAALSIWCEQAEAEMADGKTQFDISNYTAATNALRRVLTDCGLVIPIS